MNIGLGLPIADPAGLLTWARRADAGPFRTLGLLDRLVYSNPEPLVTLAALAGATSRIRVQTEVLIAPVYDTAMLAKQTATLDRMSGGRFTLGIGVGGRDDDFLAVDRDLRSRGKRLDEQLVRLRRIWAGEPFGEDVGPIGPAPVTPGGPELLFGGFADAALERVARFGDGFLGALAPQYQDRMFRKVEHFWREHGRDGEPRLVAQVNTAIGPDSVIDEARSNILEYYAFTDRAEYMVDGMVTTPARLREVIAAHTALGADEVMLYCWSPDPDQVDRIADLV
ncbi:Flavin-dependent oxidoreductase, luciferase family (includes alkanesulfonate monooxygenase SsuD and methylene tetrahydromethanopterin reductase) [Amycolatopsis xylanica]|uniref:Flavin-dependent oxidoreductase, luciferase family (Includes alkanesulfonate monooxygenase SsuD and methylene tetrahydromethanopterin reductase) n=1 Tax=Amycolatopsis xylanica TaxID=589385 RepID=A0A1H2VA80_9PSEU|nr:LLM class flavin-dependent oxidoreductase [Amycolatopsis xylanica]SDW65232.1 Flavin-dependent oxidoreductase, luciferase family (includes alkanesulfonate monooxygenase SsuD and methylene tetrahydromethanopterin reductase) [Amycolatopsis xylanica]